MSEQTLTELTNLFKNLSNTNENTNSPKQSNLSFDNAVNYFFTNMNDRGLASATKKFYKERLKAFGKYLSQIKKKLTLELVTEAEIKFYIDSRYSKHSVYTLNCNARV